MMLRKKKRLLVMVLTVAMVFVAALGGFSVDAEAADTASDIQEMYRLYNPNSGEHFYTSSTTERDNLESVGWNYEGVAWNAPKSSDTPVYRLYNANAGDHHYTMSTTERDNLISIGWSYEGIGWYSADSDGSVLYRLYNPNAQAGSHHYTMSATERDNLIGLGWNYEGTAWYGVITSSPVASDTQETSTNTEASTTVWLPQSGTKYHSTPSCSGMKNPTESTKAEAEAAGYEACKKCW